MWDYIVIDPTLCAIVKVVITDRGKLVDRVPNRTRKIGGVQVVSMTGASASPILQ